MQGGLAFIHVAGWALLVLSSRSYDLGILSGTRQLHGGGDNDEALHLGGLHVWIRHPLYAGAYLILWGGAVAPLGVVTAIFGSLYLAIGTTLEERKLTARYGDVYADYCRRVPALVPWRGRVL